MFSIVDRKVGDEQADDVRRLKMKNLRKDTCYKNNY
jgi:hypothetical protein